MGSEPGAVSPPPARPRSEDELWGRAKGLAGRTVGDVAGRHGVRVPPDTRRDKGFVGQLLELALGADGGPHDGPDFPHLGVELKSLPVDRRGRPRESTWVCVVPTGGDLPASWVDSHVFRKLARVLWIPFLAEPSLALAARPFARPLLWSPDPDEEALLRADWEEITSLLRMGRGAEVTPAMGTALQLRPKAATGRETEWSLDAEGNWVRAHPRGFYLRASFTASILARRYALPGSS